MHNLKFQKYDIDYPGSWNELSADNLLFVSGLFNQELGIESFNILALQHLTNIKWDDFFKIPVTSIAEMASTINFLHENIDLTKNMLKNINIGKAEIEGPSDQMLDLTFEQFFGHCEPSFMAYAQNNDENMKDYLVSALYAFDNGKFNPDLIDRNKKIIHEITDKQKTAIVFFYVGCRNSMGLQFPKLFSAKKSNTTDTGISYFSMIENLNNENLSNNEKIKESNIYEALTRLNSMIEKSEKKQNNV